MAISTGAQNALLPLPGTFPTQTKCIQMAIPDDPEYFRLFYGAIEALSNWYAYDRDAMHSGIFVARLWSKALRSIHVCDTGVVTVGCGCDCECCGDNMDWRQQDCQLQKFDCLTGEWVTVFDMSLCTLNPAPGVGSVQPSGGSSANTCLAADSQALTPLPWVVNSGDTLDFTSIEGASTDSSLHWFCPDGEFFVLGACAGGGYTSGSDPLPTTKHQALLLKIGSNFYPIVAGTFTVPSGVVNLVPYIQVNNSNLATTSGKYNVCVTYQNNAAPPVTPWCRQLDFTISPQTASFPTGIDGNGSTYGPAEWISGTGVVAHPQQPPPSTSEEYYCVAVIDLGASTEITFAEISGHMGTASGGVFPEEVQLRLNTVNNLATSTPIVSSVLVPQGADFTFSASGLTATGRWLYVYSIGYSFHSGSDPSIIIKGINLQGLGTPPTPGVAC